MREGGCDADKRWCAWQCHAFTPSTKILIVATQAVRQQYTHPVIRSTTGERRRKRGKLREAVLRTSSREEEVTAASGEIAHSEEAARRVSRSWLRWRLAGSATRALSELPHHGSRRLLLIACTTRDSEHNATRYMTEIENALRI
jgi:hypothetical protein